MTTKVASVSGLRERARELFLLPWCQCSLAHHALLATMLQWNVGGVVLWRLL
jgi:hypothetical protein